MAQGRKGSVLPQESATIESLRHVLLEYYRDLGKACPRCKDSSKWRREGYSLLYLRRMGDKEDSVTLPVYVRGLLRDLWRNEAAILWWLLPGTREAGPEVFFLDTLLVAPNRFRPPAGGIDSALGLRLARQTNHLKNILVANKRVQGVLASMKGDSERTLEEKEAEAAQKRLPTIDQAIHELQLAVNGYMDSGKSEKHAKLAEEGIRQLLEKKAGLFRMKMMGKRVNFAARSVISPDPNIETSDIGIPQMIAEELLYPEVATHHNAAELRALVERGKKYPGAVEVHIPMPDGSKTIKLLSRMPDEKRAALAKQLITDIESGRPPMTVFRQLRNGDPLLVNRQPTLHKPGIMAHTAKVLRFEKTIRLHYVNCNTYNADFDGDEMNLHAPQDPIGRMEALAIARADRQYLVPTSGKPLRGLIQDHVIAGTMLTKRDTYYSKNEVCLLLYHGLRAAIEGGDLSTEWARGKPLDRAWMDPAVRPNPQRFRLQLDPPTIRRPRPVWTGKQVFSMLIKNLITLCSSNRGRPRAAGGEKQRNQGTVSEGLFLQSKSKTPGDVWNGRLDGDKEEATVLFQGSDLLMGVLDKNQFGAATYGLVHLLYELMGGHLVGMLLASMARLFTLLLQMRGFTCAFADLLLREEIEEKRRELIRGARVAAKATVEEWLKQNGHAADAQGRSPTPAELSEAARPLFDRSEVVEQLEGMLIGKMKESWSDMINHCIPIGQKLPFPRNCFAAMVQTGAKGSKVNHSQVSCCLGQQELEGRLPPLMSTRRALPCFAPFDLANRTRGYIADRFLNGIRPQEFFFHCMAGREGLVDTAVKTSRSGYLQRCLSKHLESLKVCYDLTVRDGDGSVVQFLYGEDGADVTMSQYLFMFDEMKANYHFMKAAGIEQLKRLQSTPGVLDMDSATAYLAARETAAAGDLSGAMKQLSYLIKNAKELDDAARYTLTSIRGRLKHAKQEGMSPAAAAELFEPLPSIMTPSHFFGATSELHEVQLKKYLAKATSSGTMSKVEAEEFGQFMRLKFLRSLAQTGEAVGVIAAQSMGEPSTQMTLNTFHLAGHGGANVTLGIPRLREIIQTGSKTCKTPLMRVKVLQNEHGRSGLWERRLFAQSIKTKFRRLTLLDCLGRLTVGQSVRYIGGEVVWVYQCRFEFLSFAELARRIPHASAERVEATMRATVSRRLRIEIKKLLEASSQGGTASRVSSRQVVGTGDLQLAPVIEDGGAADEGEDAKGKEDDGEAARKRRRRAVGAEGRAEKEEEKAAEEDAELEGEPDDDDMSAASGMYSSADEDAGEEREDSGDEQDEAAKPVAAKRKELESDAESGDEAGPKAGEAGEDSEDESANEGAKKKKTKAEESTKADEKKRAIDGQKQGTATGKSGEKAAAEDAPPVKKRKVVAGTQERLEKGRSYLAQALASRDFVWQSKLENDEMTIIVTHRYKDCPHSLFVGELLHGICKEAQLQDPSCAGVDQVHVKDENGEVWLECEGINVFSLQVLPHGTVDIDKLYTNNIRRIFESYGVEAARTATVREIRAVFAHYGIEVDLRHLSLVADYMTQTGTLRAFNRGGMAHCASPFQQMSFESTMEFMSAACKDALVDTVASPASAIVVGQPPPVGTGVVSLLADLNPPVPKWRRPREFKF